MGVEDLVVTAAAVLALVVVLLFAYWALVGRGAPPPKEEAEGPEWFQTGLARQLPTVTQMLPRRPDGLAQGAPKTDAERAQVEIEYYRQINETMAVELWLRPPVHPLVRWLAEGAATFEAIEQEFTGSDEDRIRHVLDLNIRIGQVAIEEANGEVFYRWAGPFTSPIGTR